MRTSALRRWLLRRFRHQFAGKLRGLALANELHLHQHLVDELGGGGVFDILKNGIGKGRFHFLAAGAKPTTAELQTVPLSFPDL